MKNPVFLAVLLILLAICLLVLSFPKKERIKKMGRAASLPPAPALPAPVARKNYALKLNIKDFGAKGDGTTVDNPAFERAFRQIEQQGGGELHLPAGQYLLTPLSLVSNLSLVLDRGAGIKASSPDSFKLVDPLPSYGQGRDHPGKRYEAFLQGSGLENVAISGHGGEVIDGGGRPWWEAHKKWKSGGGGGETHTRPRLIEFMYSKNIILENITLKDSPFWTVHIYSCDRALVSGVTINAPEGSPNTDGVDPDSSSNVTIQNCYFDLGDDGVAIKSGWGCYGRRYNKPSARILVQNIFVNNYGKSSGVAVGSEIAGGVSDVTIRNCTFGNTENMLRIKFGESNDAYVKNVLCENIHGDEADAIVNVSGGYNGKNPSCSGSDDKDVPAAILANLVFRNMSAGNRAEETKFSGLSRAQENAIRSDNIKKGTDGPCPKKGGARDDSKCCTVGGCLGDGTNCSSGLNWRCRSGVCELCCPGDQTPDCAWGGHGDCLDECR